MKRPIRILLIVILLFLLFLIRAYEVDLFYDPLIVYFQNDYLYKTMPEIDTWHLIVDMLFRYTLNSLITIGIIFLVFKRKRHVKFTGSLLMIAFMILIFVFVLQLRDNFESGYLFPFYVRRFIIQPLFLLLLLPAFYYQKLRNR
jgi:exosortase F-associated protein